MSGANCSDRLTGSAEMAPTGDLDVWLMCSLIDSLGTYLGKACHVVTQYQREALPQWYVPQANCRAS